MALTTSLDGTRRGGPGHLRSFLRAGLVDSFGLAFGWTAFLLRATATEGLGTVALYQTAMLVGVALSAPFSNWIVTHLDGRSIIRWLGSAEAVCRVAVFLLLVTRSPILATALVVGIMNVLAWTGYAAMRAEAVGTQAGLAPLNRYAVCVAAAEAAATAAAVLVPIRSGAALAVTTVLYASSLIPTWIAAGAAVIRPSAHRASLRGNPQLRVQWANGGLVMFLAAGPTLLATALSYRYYGRIGVAVSALAFTAGSLASPGFARLVAKWQFPQVVQWTIFGVLMASGWMLATVDIVGIGIAQLLSGLAQTALEGTMDTSVVEGAGHGHATTALATGSAARALGGALAVAAIPTILHRLPLTTFAALATVALLTVAASRRMGNRPLPAPRPQL